MPTHSLRESETLKSETWASGVGTKKSMLVASWRGWAWKRKGNHIESQTHHYLARCGIHIRWSSFMWLCLEIPIFVRRRHITVHIKCDSRQWQWRTEWQLSVRRRLPLTWSLQWSCALSDQSFCRLMEALFSFHEKRMTLVECEFRSEFNEILWEKYGNGS